jgi:hypothetical protein
MRDNFDRFRNILTFENEDEFYFIQVLVRGKDGNKANGNNKNRTIKYYTIKSMKEFDACETEIKYLCDTFNARAYIHYSKRSYEAVAKEMLRHVTDVFLCGNYLGMKGAFQHACGKTVKKEHKTYLVDIDFNPELTIEDNWTFVWTCKDCINNICENTNDQFKVLDVIPSNSGVHLICKPFNIKKLTDNFNVEVKQNAPTLLYKG